MHTTTKRTLIAIQAFLIAPTLASYAFYVGKDLTADGSVMIGGTGEEVSGHWLQIFPAKDHAPNTTITVGVTEDAALPGELIQIPQVSHTYRYLSMEYTYFQGLPAPLTNGGLSERGIAVRDVWSPSRAELFLLMPFQRGLQYSDLARVVMERANTAREGVEIIADMIAKYGYADYGGNSHLIADYNEGWIVIEFAGGQGLWAAERLASDEARVLYPGYIQDFPIDYKTNSTNFMGSPNLVSYAVEQGWWDPDGSVPFNIFNVYGLQGNYTAREGGFKYMSQAVLEDATLEMFPLTEEKLIERVRDYRIADDQAGYGQVLSLREGIDPDLLRMWIAPTGSVTAPFIPYWMGIETVPPEFDQHRYLTTGASSSYLNPDYQLQEATHSAGRIFKQVMYYTCSDPETYLPLVQNMLKGLEDTSSSEVGLYEKAATALLEGGHRVDANKLLTSFSHSRASQAVAMGRTLLDALDSYVKLTGQWRPPAGSEINDAGEGAETVNCLFGFDPDQPAWRQSENLTRRRLVKKQRVR